MPKRVDVTLLSLLFRWSPPKLKRPANFTLKAVQWPSAKLRSKRANHRTAPHPHHRRIWKAIVTIRWRTFFLFLFFALNTQSHIISLLFISFFIWLIKYRFRYPCSPTSVFALTYMWISLNDDENQEPVDGSYQPLTVKRKRRRTAAAAVLRWNVWWCETACQGPLLLMKIMATSIDNDNGVLDRFLSHNNSTRLFDEQQDDSDNAFLQWRTIDSNVSFSDLFASRNFVEKSILTLKAVSIRRNEKK